MIIRKVLYLGLFSAFSASTYFIAANFDVTSNAVKTPSAVVTKSMPHPAASALRDTDTAAGAPPTKPEQATNTRNPVDSAQPAPRPPRQPSLRKPARQTVRHAAVKPPARPAAAQVRPATKAIAAVPPDMSSTTNVLMQLLSE